MPRHGRILVVDDEVNARTALAELLRDEGYEVETAADAFKALGKYDAFAPHVVITDLKMPGMDGIDLARKVRTADSPAAVIIMTAFGAVPTAVEAMRAGAADYLTKPINVDELLVVLARVLETEDLRREAQRLRAEERAEEHDRPAPGSAVIPDMPPIPGSTMAAIERYAILETLKATGGSTSRAAEMLGLSTRTIQYRLHEYQDAPRSQVDVVRKRAAGIKP